MRQFITMERLLFGLLSGHLFCPTGRSTRLTPDAGKVPMTYWRTTTSSAALAL